MYTLSVAPITFAYADLKQPDSESTQAAVAKCIRVYNGTRWKGNRLKYGGAMLCVVQYSVAQADPPLSADWAGPSHTLLRSWPRRSRKQKRSANEGKPSSSLSLCAPCSHPSRLMPRGALQHSPATDALTFASSCGGVADQVAVLWSVLCHAQCQLSLPTMLHYDQSLPRGGE